MNAKYPASQYFEMAQHIRSIAESILEPDTRAMVAQIAEDYERMGRDAGAAVADSIEALSETMTGTTGEQTA